MTKDSGRFAENRKARHEYEILEKFEGGLELLGSEVKAIREGGAKLDGAYVKLLKGQCWLMGAHIRPYSKASGSEEVDPDRTRRILVHKKELLDLYGKTQQKGLTLVPFSLYPSGRRIKLSFALCKGRKAHDKREKLKAQDLDRDVRRHLRGEDVE
jgi:SsrA-binding protein